MPKVFVIVNENKLARARKVHSRKLRRIGKRYQQVHKMNVSIEKQALAFDSNGFLRRGIHDCTWTDLQALAFTNCHRRKLGSLLMDFLQWTIRNQGFSYIYIGGGFLSARTRPRDIDVILETKDPFGPDAFAAVEPLFVTGLDNIRRQYSIHVHFWMEKAPPSIVDYRAFFQYARPERRRHSLFGNRGIVRISLSTYGVANTESLNRNPDLFGSSRTGAVESASIKHDVSQQFLSSSANSKASL